MQKFGIFINESTKEVDLSNLKPNQITVEDGRNNLKRGVVKYFINNILVLTTTTQQYAFRKSSDHNIIAATTTKMGYDSRYSFYGINKLTDNLQIPQKPNELFRSVSPNTHW